MQAAGNDEPRWRALRAAALLGLSVGLLGCQGAYFLVDPEAAKKVKPDYGKIGHRKLAVLVWADQATIDEFPHVRRQFCGAVTYHLKKHLEKATFVSPRAVERLQETSGMDWQSMEANEICRELGCELLLRVELFEFTTRASKTTELRKARIGAALNLFECGEPEGIEPVYSGEVKITFPPGSLHGARSLNETDFLHAAVEYFAETAAKKFYAHEVKLQGRQAR